jgi:hypothetical protein
MLPMGKNLHGQHTVGKIVYKTNPSGQSSSLCLPALAFASE